MRGKRPSAYRVYLVGSFFFGLGFMLMATISAIYRVERAGLTPFELVITGTVLEGSSFLFEIPTGIVADVYSRRLSCIIAFCLIGAGFIFEGMMPVLWGVLLAQVIWGVGYTFYSGAWDAWIADETGAADTGPIYLRGMQLSLAGRLVGSLGSVAIASIALNLPYLAGGLTFILLAAGLIVFMPEERFQRPTRSAADDSSQRWHELAATFREGVATVRAHPVLVTILTIFFFGGMASEAFDRLWEVHFLRDFTMPRFGGFQPIVWFGVMNAIALILTIITGEIVRRRADTTTHRGAARLLLLLKTGEFAAIIVFALAGQFWLAVLAYLMRVTMWNTADPVFTAWINQSVPARVRATVLSLASQCDELGQVGGGPILGAIASLISIRAALVGVAVVFSPILGLFARSTRRAEAAAIEAMVE